MRDPDNAKCILVKAMCVIVHGGQILLNRGGDPVKGTTYWRAPAGTVHFGERVLDCLHREMQEELGTGIENVRLLDVQENIFVYKGAPCHNIEYIYQADLTRKELYGQVIHVVEPYGEFDAVWEPLEKLIKEGAIIYPQIDYRALLS